MLLLRMIKVSPFILIRIFSFSIISFFCSIVFNYCISTKRSVRGKAHCLSMHQLINRFTYLVPPYLQLKMQFMKVVPPDDFIACMKASIVVVSWSVSLSLVKVFFSEMASVIALIFIEVPGMPLLLVSLT